MRIARLLLPLFGLALGLVAVEFGLRFYADLRSQQFQPPVVTDPYMVSDPLLGAWLQPNYRSEDGLITHDSRGFRNGNPHPTPAHRPMALLGGSTAYGWGADDARTLPAYMERDLAAAGQDRQIINAGMPGFTTFQSLLVYQAKVRPLQPSSIILLGGLNDVYYSSDWSPLNELNWINTVYEVRLRSGSDPALRSVVDAVDSIALNNCMTCYYAGQVFRNAYQKTRWMPLRQVAQVFGVQPMGEPNPTATKLHAWSYIDLARRVKADGGCLVIVWQPVAVTDQGAGEAERTAAQQMVGRAPAWTQVAPGMYRDLRESVARQLPAGDAQVLDLSGFFHETAERVYESDGVHYTPLGTERLAAEIARSLQTSACR